MENKDPSLTLQIAVAEAALAAVKDSFEDWDFTAAIERAYQKYMRTRLDEDERSDRLGPWFLSSDEADGLTVSFSLFDENVDEILSSKRDLFSIADTIYDDCFRSQADIIFSIERTAARLRESFEKRHGIPCEKDAIEKRTRELWP